MGSVCQTCGDAGWKDLLLCCTKCQISTDHRYCLAEIPKADDEEFTYIYICPRCVLSSTNETFPNTFHITRPSHIRKHKRLHIHQPAVLILDLKKIPDNSSSTLAEVEAGVQTLDVPPSLQSPVSKPSVKDVLPQDDLNENDRNPGSFVKDVLPHNDLSENIKSPDSVVKDVLPQNDRSPSNVVKDAVPVDDLSENNRSPSNIVKNVLPEDDLIENNRSPSNFIKNVLPEDELIEIENNRSSNNIVNDVLPENDLIENNMSLSNIVKDVLPQDGLSENNRTPGSNVKDVLPEDDLNEIKRSPSSISEPATLIQDLTNRRSDKHDVDPSLHTSVSDPFVKDVLPDADLNENNRSPRCCAENPDGDEEVQRKRRRLIPNGLGKSDEQVECQNSLVDSVAQVDSVNNCARLGLPSSHPLIERPNNVFTQPIVDPSWRGCFEFSSDKIGRFVAHLSNKACLRVVEAAKLMPTLLRIKMMPRLDAWPKYFNVSPPTDENIALYFFPGNESATEEFDKLTNQIIDHDLVLKVILDNVELLILPSNQLPPRYRRFNGKNYMWGLFKRRKDSSGHESSDSHVVQISSTGCSKKTTIAESSRMSPHSPLSTSAGSSSNSPRSPIG